jgi:MFS family permease
MSRTVAVVWHASFSIAAGVLYFFFVLPRWWELSGDTSPTLGTALRIVTGALIGLAALPVVFTLLRTRRPEFGTPQMALRLRTASIALHVLAGVLILGTAISEIWISLDEAGQWLFGIYGAAAAIALLGVFAFYLAFVAELPPPPPKPLKPKKAKKGRRGRKAVEDEATEEATEDAAEEAPEEPGDEPDAPPAEDADEKPAEVTAESTEAAEPESTAEQPESTAEDDAESPTGGLRNRRRRRSRVRG